MRRFLLAVMVLLGAQVAAFAQGLPANSLWKNQRGSTLEVFSVNPLYGQFINNAAGFQCKGTPYPATGTVQGQAVTFAVTFTQCNSHTTWWGWTSGNTMRTRWILIYTPSSGPPQTLRGADTFIRIR